MDDKRLMDMVEKFTQSTTITAMNIKTTTKAISGLADTINSMKTDHALIQKACKEIGEDIKDIKDELDDMSKNGALINQQITSALESITAGEKDTNKTVKQILIEVTKLVAYIGGSYTLLRGGNLI